MENGIKGYRKLTDEELQLVNEIKETAELVGELVQCIEQLQDTTDARICPDLRWAAIGTTNLQQGFMALTRSITKPTTF